MVNILIIDDEEDICDGIKGMLAELASEKGIDVNIKCVFSGEDALQSVHEQDYDLSIIDLKLSTAITGLDLIKEFRAKKPGMLLVAISGYIDDDLRTEAIRYGIDGYLEKPMDLRREIFTEKIEDLLRKRNTTSSPRDKY